MAKKFWKNIGIGFRLMLSLIPAGIIAWIINLIFKEVIKTNLLLGLILTIPIILFSFYFYGFFANKWRKWIFK